MLSLFEFSSYRPYLEAWIQSRGSGGHGQKGRIARALGVSSSLVSQILKGEKTLTPDQTSDLVDFLGLTEMESDYFHLLIETDRAGNPRYREKLNRKLKSLQEQSRKIARRVPRNLELNDEQKAIYYSSWVFAGIRNLAAIHEFSDAESIARHLHLDAAVVARALRFLLEKRLCREEGGRIVYGPAALHIDRESPFVNKHHQNWRMQAIQRMESRRDTDLYFTGAMSLSHEAYDEILRLLPEVIQKVLQISGPSNSETGACLNIDWFRY